jgi:hypothetical protein
MNSSGNNHLVFDLGLPLCGGVGLLEYSVKLNVLRLGVPGLELELAGVSVPLTIESFSISKILRRGFQLQIFFGSVL